MAFMAFMRFETFSCIAVSFMKSMVEHLGDNALQELSKCWWSLEITFDPDCYQHRHLTQPSSHVISCRTAHSFQ